MNIIEIENKINDITNPNEKETDNIKYLYII